MAECRSPILFIVFNRPDTTMEVLESIASARPARLYVAADGPRSTRQGESEITKKVRAAVLARIDWPCEVKTLFRDTNLGCRNGVRTAIDWFFENEAEGIILEDDVVPSPDFFKFCDYALEKYRDVPEIFMVSGTNLIGTSGKSSHYFYTSFGSIWGWATWRRAWSFYDVEMATWPDEEMRAWMLSAHGSTAARYLTNVFDSHLKYNIDTWDAQWTYSIIRHGALSIVPEANMIRNIGIVGAHSSVEMRNHNLPYGNSEWPLTPLSAKIGENSSFRDRMTEEIFLPAMRVASLSRLAKRAKMHGIMKAGYTGIRHLRKLFI